MTELVLFELVAVNYCLGDSISRVCWYHCHSQLDPVGACEDC